MVVFSYYIVVPGALKFLITFAQGVATANITVSKYMSFFVMFMLTGGIVFEIPVVMGLLAEAGMVSGPQLKHHRRFAFLIILIAAALITPTQDVVNLAVFSVPMFLLYETGILIVGLIEKKRYRPDQCPGDC